MGGEIPDDVCPGDEPEDELMICPEEDMNRRQRKREK